MLCIVCQAPYDNVDYLEIHIATEHVQYLAYECEICDFSKFPTDFALRKHYQDVHKLDNFTIKYKVTPELEEKLQELKNLLSKSLAGSTISQEPSFLSSSTPNFSSPSLTKIKPVPTVIMNRNRTIGPRSKRPRASINIEAVPTDFSVPLSSRSLVEMPSVSSNGMTLEDVLKGIVKSETSDGRLDDEEQESEVKESTIPEESSIDNALLEQMSQATSEDPMASLGQIFADTAETSLTQTGYKYGENGKCYRGYDPEFQKIFPEIQESKKGDRFFYCTVCRKDVCIGVSGIRGPLRLITQHFETAKHKKLAELAKKSDQAVYDALNPKAWGRYRSKFTKMWPEIQPSERGECYFYCTICDRDLVISQGIMSVTNHLNTGRHATNAQKKGGMIGEGKSASETTPQRQLEMLVEQESMDDESEAHLSSYQIDQELSANSSALNSICGLASNSFCVKIEPMVCVEALVGDVPAAADAILDYDRPSQNPDPSQPGSSDVYLKRPMSAYFKWTLDERPKLREQYPHLSNNEVSKKLGELWNTMSDDEKKPYFDEMRAVWDVVPNSAFKPKKPRGSKQKRAEITDVGTKIDLNSLRAQKRPRLYQKKNSAIYLAPKTDAMSNFMANSRLKMNLGHKGAQNSSMGDNNGQEVGEETSFMDESMQESEFSFIKEEPPEEL